MSRPRNPPAPSGRIDEHDAVLSPAEEARWVTALRAAWSPAPLTPARHERILSGALEDPLAEPSEDERRAAEALRLALAAGNPHSLEPGHLARALAHALAVPSEEEALASQRALERAFQKAPQRSHVVRVAFGVAASCLALAAAVALVIGSARRAPPSSGAAPEELALSRSLAPLLGANPARLSASERMDRIASVRARELRQNRYAKWGVR